MYLTPFFRTELSVRYFPNPFDNPEHETAFGKVQRWTTDLSSPSVLRGDKVPMSLSFDKATQVQLLSSDDADSGAEQSEDSGSKLLPCLIEATASQE